MKKMLVILLALFSMGFAISAFASPWTVNYNLVNTTNQFIPVWTYKGINSNHVTETSELGTVPPRTTYRYNAVSLNYDRGIGFGSFETASTSVQRWNYSDPYVADSVCSVDGVAGLQWGGFNNDLADISMTQDTTEAGWTYTLDGQQCPYSLLAHWNSDHNETVIVTIG